MGRVYLVGAGPGDPELLTLKAYRLLKEAPVVLYDRLVDERVLALAPGEKVYVGKEEGESEKQEEIHRLLLRPHHLQCCQYRLRQDCQNLRHHLRRQIHSNFNGIHAFPHHRRP